MKTAILRTTPRAFTISGIALVGLLTSLMLLGSAVHAAPKGRAYAVVLAAPLADAKREIVDGTVWRCQGDRCSAPANGERALSLCRSVAGKFGQVARFETPRGALTPDELTRCNTR